MSTQIKDNQQKTSLTQARQLLMEHALECDFRDGRLQMAGRESSVSFRPVRNELEFAAWAAAEWADPQGSFAGDARLLNHAVAALENAAGQFQPTGRVTPTGDGNTAYFALVPGLRALRLLKPAVDTKQFDSLVARCVKLFDDAAQYLNRTHDYLNPRGLEAVCCLHLYRLTDEKRFLDRCNECIDELITRQYASGAQPYHTGAWVWGRRPAQVYQMLTATLMLMVAQELNREDAVAYVRRLMDYIQLANNRRAEPFVTPFEGLHKSGTPEAVTWQWPLAAALGPDYASLARSSYENWIMRWLAAIEPRKPGDQQVTIKHFSLALSNALAMGVRDVPSGEPFTPPQGIHVLPDISTCFVHQPQLDLCATLLTGYSAFAQADCGDVRLYALTVELTDTPAFHNAGTDALREDWQTPSEQIACEMQGETMILQGRVFTKWDREDRTKDKDMRRVHARELEVKMTYEGNELLLEFETIRNTHVEPVSNRLLLMLAARPDDAATQLTIGEESFTPPPAQSTQTFAVKKDIAPVRFAAPDGSAIEIVPEETTADFVLAERPERVAVPRPGKEDVTKINEIKPANEGTLRLTFEGPAALDKGRFRIRFLPPNG